MTMMNHQPISAHWIMEVVVAPGAQAEIELGITTHPPTSLL